METKRERRGGQGSSEWSSRRPASHLEAFEVLRRLPGGSQSVLFLGTGLKRWVVKFQNNPQHGRLVLTEFIASQIARRIGLSVPRCGFIHVGQDSLLRASSQAILNPQFHGAGLHFASEHVTGLDFYPHRDACAARQCRIRNASEVLGSMVVDVWLANQDRRQLVLATVKSQLPRAWWIDYGQCFGAGEWDGDWQPSLKRLHLPIVASEVRPTDLIRWIERIERFSEDNFSSILKEVPVAFDWERRSLRSLCERLNSRRGKLRELTSYALARATCASTQDSVWLQEVVEMAKAYL